MKNKKVVLLLVGFMCCFSITFFSYSQGYTAYAESDKTYDCGATPPFRFLFNFTLNSVVFQTD